MATKPSYVGTLNAIANGERGGYELFRAWSASTSDAELQKTLDMVAIREMEHSWAFEKRLSELGFDVLPPTEKNKAGAKLLKMMKSKASDTEKFAAFGIGTTPTGNAADTEPATDGLLQILADKTIDPQTGGLIGRFICEERDSGRALLKAWKAFQRRQDAGKSTGKKAGKKAA